MSRNPNPIIPHLGLLVLDLQEAFLKAFPDPDPFIGRVKFCVETARLFNIPTLFTEQRPEVLGTTLESVRNLYPDASRVAKTGFSAFSNIAVTEWKETKEIDHLLLIGLETPICVYQTVLDAINRDLEVTVLCDAVGCRRADDASIVLEALRSQGVHLLPSETVFYSILGDCNHDSFKVFTQLVKKYSDSSRQPAS